MALDILMFLVIARAVLSWVNPDPYNPIVRFLVSSTDPMLVRIRRFVPVIGGVIDLSPLVLVMILLLVKLVLAQSLIDYAEILKRASHGAPAIPVASVLL